MPSKSLFLETASDKSTVKWTLKKKAHTLNGVEYPSAYEAYMNADTEYEAGCIICGDYEHWENLQKLQWFLKGKKEPANSHLGLEVWRKHKKLKDITEQVKNLKDKAESGDTTAAKAVLAMLKEADKIKPVGRPQKGEKEDPIKTDIKNFLKRVK